MNKLIDNEVLNRIKREYDFRHNEAKKRYDVSMRKIRLDYPDIFTLNSKIRELSVKDAKNLINNFPRIHEKELNSLINKEKELLKKHGLIGKMPSKYMCNTCEDTGKTKDGGFCPNCYYEVFLNAAYKNNLFYNLLKISSFETISSEFFSEINNDVAYPDIDEIINSLKTITHDMAESIFHRGYYERYNTVILQGFVGTGKTFLSLCMANEFIKSGIYVAIYSAMELYKILLSYEERTNHIKDKIIEAPIVLIDDFGTEYINDYYLSQLYEFLNRRKINNLPTIINTNKSMNNIEIDYSERIKSRLIEKSFIKPFKSSEDKRQY